ncbi:hypothetical protein I6G46_23040 [Serratia plymuthica]|uniref:hypothetical protein n=1 Tax=Serratia plymuthica TaxID=82996 RepID=UPI0018D93675|nr:hypothetical protein [Serratia plymuthica]QPS86963.1 hypothetical protein I6G46_23040 [Serratia plymuthica]
MAVKVNAATLINTVRYDTDMQSFRKVKKQMEDLKKAMTAKSAMGNVFNAKQVQRDAKQAVAAVKQANKQVQREMQNAQKRYKITLPNQGKGGTGTGMVGTAVGNPAVTGRQTKAMAQQQADAKLLAKQQVDAAKKRAAATRVDLNATMKQERALYNIQRMQGLDAAQKYQAAKAAQEIVNQYRRGESDLRSMNHQMSLLTQKTRDAAAAARRLQRAQKSHHVTGGSGFGLGGLATGAGAYLAGGAALAGVAGAGYAGLNAAKQSTNRNMQYSLAAKNSNTYASVIQAMVKYGREQGVDSANPEKIADNFKDVAEKIGDFQNNAAWNAKKQQWSGGGAVGDVANQLGLDKKTIDSYKDRPVEFLNLIQNQGKQLGLSVNQINNLFEGLGDDLLYYRPLFENDGAALIQSLIDMKEAGTMLTPEMIIASQKLNVFGIAIDMQTSALQDKFSLGIADAIGSTKDLDSAFKLLQEPVYKLGSLLGNTINELDGISKLISNFTFDNLMKSASNSNPKDWYNYANDELNKFIFGGSIADSIGNVFSGGSKPIPNPTILPTPTLDFSDKDNLLSSAIQYQNPTINVNLTPTLTTQVNVSPDPDFGNIIQAKTAQAVGDEFRNMTLGMQATQGNNWN